MSSMSDGYQAVLQAHARGFEPDPDLPVDEWADEYAFIPADSGANEHGKYRTSRTPHARSVMQWLSAQHPCKRVVLMGASQMLKTQVALNWFGSCVHQAPSNFLWIVPTGTLVKRASGRIDKTIRAIPVLEKRVAGKRSRDASNNLTTKEFTGGTLHVLTAGAAANLSEVSARYLVYDEIDRSDSSVQGEGSPSALAEARQTTFEQNRKAYYPSSPTIEGESAIADLFAQGTQREALADCIHCGHAQPLDFFKLIRSDDGQALYPCEECGGIHTEADKERMFARGAWSDGVGGDGETESATISQMFLPYGWFPWIGLLNKYEKARELMEAGNEHEMIVFYNTRLAKCWARAKEQTKYDDLMARVEPYRLGTMPAGALVLTAAVDTQNDRLEFKVVGWGPGLEGWVVDYQVIMGSPAEATTWARLDELLLGRYRHAGSGQMLNIAATFIDSGGSATQEVYQFAYTRRKRHVYAIKGASRPNRPILSGKPSLVDVKFNGQTDKKGAQMWFVGTDTAKDYLAARWVKTQGPGAIHFPTGLDEGYYKQLTAEYLTYVFRRGHKVRVWEKKQNDRNEAGDLMVYNLAAAHFAGLHKKTEHQWRVLRDRLNPAEPELFGQDDQASAEPLQLDNNSATISAVALTKTPEKTSQSPEIAADTAQAPAAPARPQAKPKPARARTFPHRNGWVKKW
jgi:phage terminase large subunit GpA-like protein